MSTILNILHLVFSFFGILFIGYVFYLLYQKNRWRFHPAEYQKSKEIGKIHSRIAARKNGRKEKKYDNGKVIIWAENKKHADKVYEALKSKKPSLFKRLKTFISIKLGYTQTDEPIEIFK